MVQKIELNLVEQINKTTGEQESLSVELLIDNENNSSKTRRRYFVHSVPESLESSLDKWKEALNQIVNRSSRKDSTTAIKENLSQVADDDDDYGISIDDDNDQKEAPLNCWESYQNLTTELNNWLESEKWSKVIDLLTKNIDISGEISVTIQTNNSLFKQLPWLEWNIFREYSEAEIAISPPEYEPPLGWEDIQGNPQIRILVILGDNDNINLDRDSQLLNEVRKHGARLEFLEQPTLEELKAWLQEETGWNIIFYSGHSETNENGQGILYLNNNDRKGITIDDVENELKFAIDKGLCLAIFNSCDGLGIANKLAELRLPVCIVMKESIPNEMAIHFLEYFLKYFCHDLPLFVAVRKTRKELEKQYNNPDKYPGGHSLPIIVPNPAVPLPTWKSFLSEYQLPLKLRVPIIIGVILGVLGLPLSIIYEFGFKTFLQYAKLYPHMIIYPICFLWAAIWGVCQSFSQIINKSINKFKWGILGMLFVSIALLSVEVTSPNMLLFELSPSAQSIIDNQVILEVSAIKGGLDSIKEISSEIVDTRDIINEDKIVIRKPILEEALSNYLELKKSNKITESQAIGFHNLMYLGLDYKTTWKGGKNWISISRWFYGYTFWLIIFTILIFFVLWVQVQDPRKFFNQVKYCEYLVFSQAMILFWIPFRFYYLNEPKNLIFNYKNLNFWQPLDPFVYVTISFLFLSTLDKIIRQKEKNWILIIITVVFIAFNLILGAQTELLSRFFGVNTIDDRMWILLVVFSWLFIYLFSNYLVNHNQEL